MEQLRWNRGLRQREPRNRALREEKQSLKSADDPGMGAEKAVKSRKLVVPSGGRYVEVVRSLSRSRARTRAEAAGKTCWRHRGTTAGGWIPGSGSRVESS